LVVAELLSVKITLPFTPGIIPKRKDSLAKAVGIAVGENLLTKEDIVGIFEDEKMIITLTTTQNQRHNANIINNNMMSTIDLGDCENLLRKWK